MTPLKLINCADVTSQISDAFGETWKQLGISYFIEEVQLHDTNPLEPVDPMLFAIKVGFGNNTQKPSCIFTFVESVQYNPDQQTAMYLQSEINEAMIRFTSQAFKEVIQNKLTQLAEDAKDKLQNALKAEAEQISRPKPAKGQIRLIMSVEVVIDPLIAEKLQQIPAWSLAQFLPDINQILETWRFLTEEQHAPPAVAAALLARRFYQHQEAQLQQETDMRS